MQLVRRRLSELRTMGSSLRAKQEILCSFISFSFTFPIFGTHKKDKPLKPVFVIIYFQFLDTPGCDTDTDIDLELEIIYKDFTVTL